jgi:hypothetical protein
MCQGKFDTEDADLILTSGNNWRIIPMPIGFIAGRLSSCLLCPRFGLVTPSGAQRYNIIVGVEGYLGFEHAPPWMLVPRPSRTSCLGGGNVCTTGCNECGKFGRLLRRMLLDF